MQGKAAELAHSLTLLSQGNEPVDLAYALMCETMDVLGLTGFDKAFHNLEHLANRQPAKVLDVSSKKPAALYCHVIEADQCEATVSPGANMHLKCDSLAAIYRPGLAASYLWQAAVICHTIDLVSTDLACLCCLCVSSNTALRHAYVHQAVCNKLVQRRSSGQPMLKCAARCRARCTSTTSSCLELPQWGRPASKHFTASCQTCWLRYETSLDCQVGFQTALVSPMPVQI